MAIETENRINFHQSWFNVYGVRTKHVNKQTGTIFLQCIKLMLYLFDICP